MRLVPNSSCCSYPQLPCHVLTTTKLQEMQGGTYRWRLQKPNGAAGMDREVNIFDWGLNEPMAHSASLTGSRRPCPEDLGWHTTLPSLPANGWSVALVTVGQPVSMIRSSYWIVEAKLIRKDENSFGSDVVISM